MGIKQRVSTFTTDYNPAQTSRVSNIHLLADALDGAIVPPDGIFSFNERIGPRTAEKGYQEAPTIVQGELTMTVGGGVCQVGTTIFNAIFFGGYPIVERHNHSFYISHYPAGRDATVSYGSLDFRFKNNTSAYILIKAWYSASTLTISLYSTDFGNNVSYTTSEFSNYVAFPIKYIDDPALPKGTQVVEDEGVDGRDVTVFRTVKRGGVVILQDKFFSRYKPKKATIRNGTAEVPPPTAETTPTP
jgi:vancomycin resistance protein YoaR